MNKLIILLVVSCVSIHLKHNQNLLFPLYLDNDGLDKAASEICSANSDKCEIRTCSQNPDLKYLHLGANKDTQAVIVCNIHARQVITAEICLNWAKQYFKTNYTNISVDLIYLANRNREQAIKNTTCVRKSESGIDLNRNFPTEFDFYKSPKTSQIYPGASPISEPITKCIERLTNSQNLQLFIDIHSGQNGGLFYQQGYNSQEDRKILQKLDSKICNSNCRITTLARDRESINGHIFADLKVRKNIPHSILIQSYGNSLYDQFKSDKQCLIMFNPVTKEEKQKYMNKWTQGFNLIFGEIWNTM